MEKIADFFVKAAKNKQYGLIVFTLVLLIIVLAGWFGIYWILWDWIVVEVFGLTSLKLTYLEFVGLSFLIRWVLPSSTSKEGLNISTTVEKKED